LLAVCRGFLVLGVFAATAAASPAACASPSSVESEDPEAGTSRGATALVTGIAIAGASLAYGGTLLTTGHGLAVKHDGLYVMSTGLTLAPLLAHGVVGEWSRGAVFSILPALGGIGMAALLAVHPDAPIKGKDGSQRIYPVLISVSVLGSALGIFDAALVDERLPHVALAVNDGFVAADVSGRF
jgi:hypothetical protein